MSNFTLKEHIQNKATPIKALTLLLTIGSVGLFAQQSYTGTTKLLQGYERQGWGKALKANSAGTLFLKCITHDTCTTSFTNNWKKHLPWWWIITSFIGMFGFGITKRLTAKEYITRDPGAARFATKNDPPMEKYIKQTPQFTDNDGKDQRRGYLGLLEDGTVLKPPMSLRCSHGAIMGGPGARKSTGYHKPNMVFDAVEESTSIVIDLKYPDPRGGFFDMAPAFHKLGRTIEVFTPFDENTMRLNLLETAINLESALELANMIIPTQENESGSFYRNIERTVLAALLLSVANSEKPSMRAVYEQVIQGAAKLKEFIMSNPDPEIRDNASAMVDIKTDQLTGIVASLSNVLAIFRSQSLARATTPMKGNNLDLRRCFEKPTLLYIGIPQGEIIGGRGQVLLQLIKRTIDQAMFDVAKRNGGRLPIHTVFYLDEFANLGPLPSIAQNFATMRSYNVSYQVTLQNRAQGEALYGKIEFTSFFENNLQFQIVFPAFLKMSDAKLYSEMMGEATVLVETESESTRGGMNLNPANRTKGKSKTLRAQALVTPDQFLDWPSEQAIIFPIGVRPIPVYMPRLDESSIKIIDSKGKPRKLVNPNHHYFQELLEEYHRPGEMQKFMAKIIGDRKVPGEEEEEIRAIPLEEEFRAWILNLSEHGAYVTPFRDQNKAIISKQDLPASLVEPLSLPEFVQHGWITSAPDKFKLSPDGAKAMGQTMYHKLCSLEFGGRLMLWINANARMLRGHPASMDDLVDDNHLMGYYEPEAVMISKDTALEVFNGNLPPQEYLHRRDTRTYYRIPLGDDEAMLKIYKLESMPTKNMKGAMKAQAKGTQAETSPETASPETDAPQGPKAAETSPEAPDADMPPFETEETSASATEASGMMEGVDNKAKPKRREQTSSLGGGKPRAQRTNLGDKGKKGSK